MSTKDAVVNGNAAMKEVGMKSLSKEAADSAESSARRTARAGARREPCMLNGHSSTKVGLDWSLEASERKPMSKRRARVAPPESREDRPSDAWAGDVCRACGQHRHGSDNVCGGSG